MSIVISELDGTPVAALPVEIAERKGLGHPDTVCDAIAEEVSLALSRFYVDRFGFVLHHNVDKVLLRGGAARPAFGGGEVDEPIELYLAGRATQVYRGVTVPIDALVLGSVRAWLATHLHALDVDRHVRIHNLIRPGSRDLVELFERQRKGTPRLANDTSMGVGFAPLSPIERAVLAAERSLQDRTHSERGEGVKVMGLRLADRSVLTVSRAFVDRHLPDLDAHLGARTRANGLITPARPMTLESIAGKNPITHVGKLYHVAATRIAEALVSELDTVREAHVMLVSRIGTPIEEPQVVHVRLRTDTPGWMAEMGPRARELTRQHLAAIGSLWEELLTRNLAMDEGVTG